MLPPERSTTLTLLGLALFAALAAAGTDQLLLRSDAFWRLACARDTDDAQPLFIDRALRAVEPAQIDLVVMGSSVAGDDVDLPALAPAVGATPESSLLLALPQATITELSMLAPRVADLRPRVVVMVVTSLFLLESSAPDALRFYDPGTALSIYGWAGLFQERAAHASQLLGASHVVIRWRRQLRAALFQGPLAATGAQRRAGAAQEAERRAARFEVAPACEGAQVEALRATREHVAAAGAALVVARAPIRAGAASVTGAGRALRPCLSGLAEEVGFVYVGSGGRARFRREHFEDRIHLNAAGRTRFTEHLAEALASR